jgi:hypothetical protein
MGLSVLFLLFMSSLELISLRALLNMGFYMGLNGYVFGIGKVSYKA